MENTDEYEHNFIQNLFPRKFWLFTEKQLSLIRKWEALCPKYKIIQVRDFCFFHCKVNIFCRQQAAFFVKNVM